MDLSRFAAESTPRAIALQPRRLDTGYRCRSEPTATAEPAAGSTIQPKCQVVKELFPDADEQGSLREVSPGAFHLPRWLTVEQQKGIVEQFRQWSSGPVPMRAPKVRGRPMSVQMVCLGWHWQPYKYTRHATDVNGCPVLEMPEWMLDMGTRAINDTDPTLHGPLGYRPDVALVNYYDHKARMGMHQDKDERAMAPVVSLSIGDSCVFRFGNTESRARPYKDVTLRSGDLFVFGGPSRLAYHGVTKVFPGTAPGGCGLDGGRINITMRETGLSSPA